MIFAHLIWIASSLPSDASALESAISALEREIATLDNSSRFWELLGPICTALVVIGVIAEVAFIWREHKDVMGAWRRGIIRPPDRPSTRWLLLEIVGSTLIVVGDAGELWAGLEIAQINGQLRSKNFDLRSKSDQLLALVTLEAGDANERASRNEREAAQLRKDAGELEDSISWRRISLDKRPSIAVRLKSYRGQVAWLAYNMNDVEANDFGVDIAKTLKLAHWIPTEPKALLKMFEGPVWRLLYGTVGSVSFSG